MENLEQRLTELLRFYARGHRPLPWRNTKDPYAIWVSEIMLQQTRAEVVTGYYHRFLTALPTIAALAEAEEQTLLKLWEGLGYYSRVRNLQKAAKMVMEQYGGRLPETKAELLRLPGIGAYTAGAVASIAFGQQEAAVDGNVLRVFTRLTGDRRPIDLEETKKEIAEQIRSALPKGCGGTVNQALMELGAVICLPNGLPKCESCPWQEHCRAKKEMSFDSIPVRLPKRARKILQKTVFCVLRGQETFLCKRPDKGLLAGLYLFPEAEGTLNAAEAEAVLRRLGIAQVALEPLPAAKHVFTHLVWEMTGYLVRLTASVPEKLPGDWIPCTLTELRGVYPVPSAHGVYQAAVADVLAAGEGEN